MRGLVWLALVGCGFQPSSGAVDAAATTADGGADAVPDAPCSDVDHDGLCDDADVWPCGALPPDLGPTLQMIENGVATTFTLTQIGVNGMGRLAVGAPGSTVNVSVHLVIVDDACGGGGCTDQLEIGWAPPGDRTGCLFDQNVPVPNGVNVDRIGTITLPSMPGVHDMRVSIGQNTACGTGTWNEGPPGPMRTLAKVCVH